MQSSGKWEYEVKRVLGFNSRNGWRVSMLKLAFTETLYGIWKYRNDVVFHHHTNSNTYDSIIDFIMYMGWSSKKIKNHIASLMV